MLSALFMQFRHWEFLFALSFLARMYALHAFSRIGTEESLKANRSFLCELCASAVKTTFSESP
jgi:hypothetical protein